MKNNIKDIIIPISVILFFSMIVIIYLFFLKKDDYVVDDNQTNKQINNSIFNADIQSNESVENNIRSCGSIREGDLRLNLCFGRNKSISFDHNN